MDFLHTSIVPLRAKSRQLLLAAAAVLIFAAYTFFPAMTSWQHVLIFNSPDETANFFFARQWATGSGLRAPEPLDVMVGNIIHPRSVTVINGALAPVSFVGLPVLFGSVAIFLTPRAIPFLTPALTVLALGALYSCWRRFCNRETALFSTLLAAAHPAVWYFTSRGLFPNMVFLDFAIFAWWGINKLFDGERFTEWLLFSATMIMLALLMRSVEIIWFLPLLVALFYLRRQSLSESQRNSLIGFAIFAIAIVIMSLVYKNTLFGYHVAVAGRSFISYLGHGFIAVVFPFGFHLLNIIRNIFSYGLLLFWPLSALVLYGVVAHRTRLPQLYFYAALFVTLVLWFYYGSATIQDSVGMQGLTIGNSFVRYWLASYLLWLPWAALAIEDIVARSGTWRTYVPAMLVILFVAWSFVLVFFDRAEGLVSVAARLETYRRVHDVALQVTGDDAVIVSERADKIFFPDRRVIAPGDRPVLTYPEVIANLPVLADLVPTYYYLDHPLSAAENVLLTNDRLYLGHAIALPNGAALYPIVHL